MESRTVCGPAETIFRAEAWSETGQGSGHPCPARRLAAHEIKPGNNNCFLTPFRVKQIQSANVVYPLPPITRAVRADQARVYINSHFNDKRQAFLNFVLSQYVTVGVEELEQTKLPPLLRLKYHDSITDAVADLSGKPEEITKVFAGFQKYLCAQTD